MDRILISIFLVLSTCHVSHSKILTGRSCLELIQNNVTESGIYFITPCQHDPDKTVEVYCDMETDDGGWTIIQRRDNYTEQENFTRSWEAYANGFGSMNKDFWLGNDVIHCLTAQLTSAVRIDLEDFEGQTAWTKYETFSVDDRSNLYKLHVTGYTGNAGDSLDTERHNGMKFSTVDQDNDIASGNRNCAQIYKGGWWYGSCHYANLNGLYLHGKHASWADGVEWYHWKGFYYSLKKTEIKIRGSGILPPWNTNARSCLELKQSHIERSGVYSIKPCQSEPKKTVKVYCDMETDDGGWTIIQRRDNYIEQENFTRSWEDYATGFGSMDKDFWLGNDVIHCLTSQLPTTVRFDLEDFQGQMAWAKYETFSVDDRTNLYKLHVTGYTGNAGDSLDTERHNGMKFSTVDQDNDIASGNRNCAQIYKGGWWYGSCHYANLNGLYLHGKHASWADGVEWYHWKGFYYSLKKTEIKIRGSGIFPPWTTEAPYTTTTPTATWANCTTLGQTYQHGEAWFQHCRDLTCNNGHVHSTLNKTCCQSGTSDYNSGSTWLHHCKRFKCDNGEAQVIGKDPTCGDCDDSNCSSISGFCTAPEKSCDGTISRGACSEENCVCCIPKCF